MQLLYLVRIEDLGEGDFVMVDCTACHHVALLTPEALLRSGLSPKAKVLDLKGRLRCRGYGRKRRAVVSIRAPYCRSCSWVAELRASRLAALRSYRAARSRTSCRAPRKRTCAASARSFRAMSL
jgi:hypothetical protein